MPPAPACFSSSRTRRYALETASRGYVLQTGSIIAGGACSTLRNDDRVRQAYLGRSAAEGAKL
jgi:branched-chain amino acid transport system ATP-binding protein